jgi:hypothetical protein
MNGAAAGDCLCCLKVSEIFSWKNNPFKMKVDACKTYQEYQVLLPEAKDQEKQDYLGKKMNEFVDGEMEKEAKDSSDLTGLFANE